jgi:plastocyanin
MQSLRSYVLMISLGIVGMNACSAGEKPADPIGPGPGGFGGSAGSSASAGNAGSAGSSAGSAGNNAGNSGASGSSQAGSAGNGGSSVAGSSGMAGGAGTAGAPPITKVYQCTASSAEDHLNETMVTIQVAPMGLVYSPACIRIKQGTTVTWTGSSSLHPLEGSMTEGTQPNWIPSGPLTDSSIVLKFDQVGSYGYQCQNHGADGMTGAIFVEP